MNDIREMHYDFKQKLNKVDSQKYRNILVPEIDWKLNEAADFLIRMVAFPRYNNVAGFEITQRVKDDLSALVVRQTKDDNTGLVPTKLSSKVYKITKPTNYNYYIESRVHATKGSCKGILVGLSKVHGNRDNESSFDSSSFEWENANLFFVGNDIHIHTDETFEPTLMCLTYYKKLPYMHNARDYKGGQYLMPDGVTTLTGYQNCELKCQRDIVDLAVLLTTGDLMADYTIKLQKTKGTD